MDTETKINIIIGHIAGLPDHSRNELSILLKKSTLGKIIEIIDVDIITSKIIEDKNMEILFNKYEYYLERSHDVNLTQAENKLSQTKAKQIEKKMFQYWKAKMEYYINKLATQSKKKILLIGYLSFFKNHKIYLNLNIIPKFFLKVDHITHAKSIIKYNLEKSSNDIIQGEFDLNYLNIDFLVKKRAQLQNIYSKINYVVMSLGQIINTLELYSQTKLPNALYYASFVKYDKKIPLINGIIHAYSSEWLSLSTILNTLDNLNKINNTSSSNYIVEKGIKNNESYIKISKQQAKLLSSSGYIYEISQVELFMPWPTKNNIYKYFTVRPIKINRVLEINNILEQIKHLNINVEIY